MRIDEANEGRIEPSPVVVRKKEKQTKLTDEEVFIEMRTLCNPGDPYKKFNLSKELGSGFVQTKLKIQITIFIPKFVTSGHLGLYSLPRMSNSTSQ